ncbi:thioredoxin domain-containing protein [Spiractinospora alimapuensis]|uniref:thioredoxin domain-containing protein n=1 Tax=Spiractinospora alimapuensis TaxID=2820884 RepID=UPI001F46C070|nr:thioredoxin domain-containing protein [Spiractinospora alimapuensis]QVQ51441.1 thioredoxin domain-containing protein [Spiractinospora alimapuensis]
MSNRLADATSPYLLQHADNPVDWYPWGEEALAEARIRDVPLLISVGYAACHWCHVMAHESFEDEDMARRMNRDFVNVKVDREERPDIDAVYMTATQALTGHGGWPMTVFARPDGTPFYCGTYYPRPQFQRLLAGVTEAWREQREDLDEQSDRIAEALRGAGLPETSGVPDADALDAAVDVLHGEFDPANGGFGTAPKFPPSMVLEFLLRHHSRHRGAGATAERALDMTRRTAEAMARGGIYDQLAGGFARYSVDAHWRVPHFEKMLYDNALLARSYAHLWRQTGDPLAARVATETVEWMLVDLRTEQGGFASSLDADSEGEEGRFYVWTPAELRTVLGDDDGRWATDVFGVTATGTFEHGTSVLQRPREPEDEDRYQRVRRLLREHRERRVWPARDDKVVASWNGLAIAALAEAGVLFSRPDFVHAARDAAELLATVHLSEGRLLRTSRDGTVGTSAGVLEDYANTAEGLLALHAATGEARWVDIAEALLTVVLRRFGDGAGGFFDTADDAERLYTRPQDPTDNATPSGQFAAAGALLSCAGLTGSTEMREAAAAALSPATLLANRAPRFSGWGLAVAEALLAGPVQIAVVGDPRDPATARLHQEAMGTTSPGAVVSVGDGRDDVGLGLLRGRTMVDGQPAAYVCEDFACRLPVTTVAELRAAVR